MNPIRLLSIPVLALVLLAEFQTLAIDVSTSIALDRYTILSTGELEHATGRLLKDGRFRVTAKYTVDPFWYGSLSDFEPISGRPLLPELMYDALEAERVIPNLVRSKETFSIGYMDYVIVCLKGGDPNPRITIVKQPQTKRAVEGTWASFSVEAQPEDYLSYQWYFKGKAIPGANWSSVFIEDVTSKNAGIYQCNLSTGGKVVKTKAVLLQIVKPVAIVKEPKSQTVKQGKTVTFRVALSGTPPFQYQWYFGGAAITNATKSFFTIGKVGPEDAGAYIVYVNNGPTWALSEAAVLTVNP